jgi:L-lysine 2,3-aminomutase
MDEKRRERRGVRMYDMNSSALAESAATNWRRALAAAIRDPDRLCDLLDLPETFRRGARLAAKKFGLLAPMPFVTRIRKGDPNDPLLRQILPVIEEEEERKGYTADPLLEIAEPGAKASGLIQKYAGRVLLITSHACAVNCRYCFRRHFPYEESPRSLDEFQPAVDAIAEDESIREVILSGGDPLIRTDDWLAALVDRLSAIPHVQRLRVHTRLPIVIPQRMTPAMLDWLTGGRLTPYVVVHANHANEIDDEVAEALSMMVNAGVVVLCQSVLLKGVNDSVEAMTALCERLVDLRVLPYYLHRLDRVAGAAHFEASDELGRAIIAGVATRLPGYAVPKFVVETPGEPNKVAIG